MSKDTNFQDIINTLQKIHDNYEDLRFGQVIQISIDKSKRKNNINLVDKSSKEILKALKEFESDTKTKRQK